MEEVGSRSRTKRVRKGGPRVEDPVRSPSPFPQSLSGDVGPFISRSGRDRPPLDPSEDTTVVKDNERRPPLQPEEGRTTPECFRLNFR